ncbi:O-antigen ligase family protein [Acidaminococcus massiliensis]|uniref:O-antigen ligase family protein n=1 Tax=Acidaminococcus massiliensis TaxID=1852375 RepID=UPI00266B971D|nr:O-antigen ligase family protein [Acidaminococcus massiliensis]
MSIGKKQIEFIILSLGIFSSIISQIGPLMEVMRPVMFFIWGFIFFCFGIANFKDIKISKFSFIFTFLYIFYLGSCFLKSFYDPSYLDSNFITVLLPPLLITLIGDFYKPVVSFETIRKLMIVFVFSALIYAVYVQFTYFPSLSDWLGNKVYAFTSKNSAAQIWGCAVILIMTLLKFQNKYIQIGFYGIAVYLIALCLLSQCRTAILGLGLAYGWYVIKNKKNRVPLVLVTLLCLAIAVLNWENLSDYVNKILFLGAQDNLDVNRLSSGRVEYFGDAVQHFFENPLLGIGSYYVDNHYLCVLTESGILGFFLIEAIWLMRIILNVRYKDDIDIYLFFRSITLFYFVESLFEAYPPFGPGVCAVGFWLLSQLLQKY